jgi:phage terminase small subunit
MCFLPTESAEVSVNPITDHVDAMPNTMLKLRTPLGLAPIMLRVIGNTTGNAGIGSSSS